MVILSSHFAENELISEEMNRIGCAYVTVCEIISNMNNLDGCIIVTIFANFISSIVTTGYYGDLLFTEFSGNNCYIAYKFIIF